MMLDGLRFTLRRLRGSISDRIERAYAERDAASDEVEMAYAEGKAHAYAVAETEIIRAEQAEERVAAAPRTAGGPSRSISAA